MKYSKVYLDSIGYQLPPVVVTSDEIEERLSPLLEKLYIPEGQLEALTGISERRWWEPNTPLSYGAIESAKKAVSNTNVPYKDIGVLIYAGVCRESFEPATACRVAASLNISQDAAIYDLSNACLGVLNGIVDIANRIELGQIKAGLVVSCESAREINEITIKRILKDSTMEKFVDSIATFTGGSGAVALLLTDGSYSNKNSHKLLGGVNCSAPQFYKLCRWGMKMNDLGYMEEVMNTDAVAILKNGVELGVVTWKKFLDTLSWTSSEVDKIVCHQVGESHRNTILERLGISPSKDFFTFPFLGNIGTVSLPITAAIAQEREFILPGDKVGFLGIGSGLNTIMLGWEW